MTNSDLSHDFESYRRDRNKRRLREDGLRDLGAKGEVIRQLEAVEEEATRNAQLAREATEFFADATRTAAGVVQQINDDREVESRERIGGDVEEFLGEVRRTAESCVRSLAEGRSSGGAARAKAATAPVVEDEPEAEAPPPPSQLPERPRNGTGGRRPTSVMPVFRDGESNPLQDLAAAAAEPMPAASAGEATAEIADAFTEAEIAADTDTAAAGGAAADGETGEAGSVSWPMSFGEVDLAGAGAGAVAEDEPEAAPDVATTDAADSPTDWAAGLAAAPSGASTSLDDYLLPAFESEESEPEPTPAPDSGDDAALAEDAGIGVQVLRSLLTDPERLRAALRALLQADVLTPEEARDVARALI